jgi:PTH1 family peptidyl-tRNA hydrolase
MKKILVGLGNIGKKYENTRHNSGFMFIDYFLKLIQPDSVREKKLKGTLIYEVENEYIFVKPQTYMNKSGIAVKDVAKWFHIDITKDLILIHDDLDIPLGNFKFQYATSPRVHGGVQSVENFLGTKNFYRLRIGVDNRGILRVSGKNYVLERFKDDEIILLNQTFKSIIEKNILSFLSTKVSDTT